MSGQQEPWSELDRLGQLDPRDSTLDLSGLISRLNNGSSGKGRDTVPYARPPQRAEAEPDVAKSPAHPVPPVSAAGGAHAAVTVRPEQYGANGHAAIAAYGAYAAQGGDAPPRHSRETLEPESAAQRETAAESDVTAEPEGAAEPGAEPNMARPEAAPQPAPAAPAARPERPAPGSLADLRQRLERLPLGHPSSPYHVDGERKPPPYRLKHLELAPPTPSRTTQAYSPPPIARDDPVAAATTRTAPAAADTPGSESIGERNPGSAMLTQDQMRIANDAHDRFRAAEGRNLFGSYGSTGLTAVLRGVAASLEYGELAPDTEQNALLEPEAFKARFAAMLARYPDRGAELLARRIPGAISYSFIFDAERYSAGIWMTQDALTATGFQLLGRRNDWHNTANKCVATMWHDPTSGLPFEVQFHTAASLEAQQLARSSATLINDPRIPAADAASLQSDLAAAWAALPAPPGHTEIGEYRRQGGPPPGSATSD